MNRRSFLASALGVFAAALLGKPEPEGPAPTIGFPPGPEFDQPAGVWGKPTDADTFCLYPNDGFTRCNSDWYTITGKWQDGGMRWHDSRDDS